MTEIVQVKVAGLEVHSQAEFLSPVLPPSVEGVCKASMIKDHHHSMNFYHGTFETALHRLMCMKDTLLDHGLQAQTFLIELWDIMIMKTSVWLIEMSEDTRIGSGG